MLHAACEVGNEEIVGYLLVKVRLDPNLKSMEENSYSPLEIACLNGHPKAVNMLLRD